MSLLSAPPPAVLIPAAGFSGRMGTSKALLNWAPGISFLEKLILTYTRAGCQPVCCTLNAETLALFQNRNLPASAHLILNTRPELGRLHSIRLGLAGLEHSPYCFIQNVDNPLISVPVIQRIFAGRRPDAWVSPEFRGKGGHPVLLPEAIIRQLQQTHSTVNSLQDFLRLFPKTCVEMPDDTVLRNINTPADYEELLSQQPDQQNGYSSHQSVSPEY